MSSYKRAFTDKCMPTVFWRVRCLFSWQHSNLRSISWSLFFFFFKKGRCL